MREPLPFTLNGQPVSLEVEPTRTLLWVLRIDLGLTGTKYGCGESHCGACTVVVDGHAQRSCQLRITDVRDKKVVTIEGLARKDALHPLQEAFVAHGASQCGFCTPGMIMSAYGLLARQARPTRDQIVGDMDGNLCRCGTYKRILEAIEAASSRM